MCLICMIKLVLISYIFKPFSEIKPLFKWWLASWVTWRGATPKTLTEIFSQLGMLTAYILIHMNEYDAWMTRDESFVEHASNIMFQLLLCYRISKEVPQLGRQHEVVCMQRELGGKEDGSGDKACKMEHQDKTSFKCDWMTAKLQPIPAGQFQGNNAFFLCKVICSLTKNI